MSGKDLVSGQCAPTGPSPKHGFWWPIPAFFQASSWVGQGATASADSIGDRLVGTHCCFY